MDHILTYMTFIPLAGMAFILCMPGGATKAIRLTALGFTIPPLLMALWLFANFDRSTEAMQFMERAQWIPSFNIQYIMGVDGLSVTMILLTALLCPICILASWNIEKGVKGYFALFLLLDAGMTGVFCALDFFLFYIFWEVMLLPMYFLIGIWGGARREYAAIKFFLYTLAGSVLMMIAMLALYFYNEPHTFDMLVLMDNAGTYSRTFQTWTWLALFIGFAIKIPAFPFHTWLPDAHVEAPTAISVILAGVLLKMGTYGILRFCYPMLPLATQDMAFWALAALGTWNIVYGALCAMAQTDMKKLVAYSSISHMGYVMLGMATMTVQGINGAVLQMFNHGTITAMLFLLVGVVYDRAHHRRIDGFGGLASVMPVYTGIMVIAFFAAMGLPGLSAFISEVLVLLGAWQYSPGLAIVAASAVVLTAGYMLWMLQRVWLGPVNEEYASMPDVNAREILMLAPLAVIVIVLGVYPHAVLDLINTSLTAINNTVLSAVPPLASLPLDVLP
ncbi:MAG TPA: NADH-quinone oxidoreductase subunit M [Deltaproteobacteria bacterium]|nr:NADH-quinone oxidoreductase subunit M [Candidatus Binatota bacterium]HIL13464.1 NADH-quinone oxidoreductase subunit M [Deltaproteobacteria bacterium]